MFFAWTPLINSSDFSGISTDLGLVAAGVIGIMLIILGIGVLIKALGR